MKHFYWERHPGGPFVTLVAVATTYLHPEANEPEALQRRARRAGEGEGEFPLVVLDPREYEVMRARDPS